MSVVVLGMHKSGTSLVAESLHGAGIDMGNFDTALGYDQSNKFERHETQAINRQLLHKTALPTLRGIRMERRGSGRAGHPLNNDSLSLVSKRLIERACAGADRAEADELIDKLTDKHGPRWGFKDPRTVLVWSFWSPILTDATKLGVYRGFYQVMRRYRFKSHRPINQFRAARSWLVHNRDLADLADATPDMVILCYEALMAQGPEFGRLEAAVGTCLPDRRRAELHRERDSERYSLPGVPQSLVAAAEATERRLAQQRQGQLR